MKIPVLEVLEGRSAESAGRIRTRFRQQKTRAINLMASPGAGKTSLILATYRELAGRCSLAVVEGDLASVIDAETMQQAGLPVVQIQTGGRCHLDAPTVERALEELPRADLVFIENIGNLVCPAGHDLGEQDQVVVCSVPEGHDKPFKYPPIFAAASAVILNKADLIGPCEFDSATFERGLRLVNPDCPLFVLSCRPAQGLLPWVQWLLRENDAASK